MTHINIGILRLVLPALWLMSAVTWAADGGGRHKMSSLVRRALSEHGMTDTRRMPDGERFVCAFVRADTAVGGRLLADNGCRVHDRRGDIYIADIPVSRLDRIAASRGVSRIEASRSCSVTMDTTASIVRADAVHSGAGLPQAYTGRGVVVGVMDVGFDLTHPNFYDATATDYRIGAFWDQLDTDTVGSQLPVGRDYRGREALLAKARSADAHLISHGTHTLGIAAGSGYDSPYRGMAPESEICAVSNAVTTDTVLIAPDDLYKYTTATDALGFKYIFDYAANRGLPCVASFSEGYHVGFDTEDSLFCDYLGRLTGPGRIIVTSAGNESLTLNRLHKPADTAEAGSFVSIGGTRAVLYARADGPFRLRLEGYGGMAGRLLDVCSDSCAADSTVVFRWPEQDGVAGGSMEIHRYRSAFDRSDTIYRIVIATSAPVESSKRVALVTEGAGSEVEVKTAGGIVFVNSVAGDVWSMADCAANVLAPGCFPTVITVGATIHRTGFVNYQGIYKDYSQPGRNDGVLAWYSSVGPGTGGCMKPDVVAPGSNVVSSYSSYYLELNPTAGDIGSDVSHFEFNCRTYAWNSNAGTSMSAPVVAGAVALWLQARPDLTPGDVLDVISRTSRQPEEGLEYPNNRYGHGEIDVRAGLFWLLGLDSVEGLETAAPRGVTIRYADDGSLRLRFAAAPPSSFGIRMWSVAGAPVFSTAVSPCGSADVSVPLPPLARGVYAVQVDGEGGGSVLIRI